MPFSSSSIDSAFASYVTNKPPCVFLTVTWSADLTHFSLLHQSLASSPLASLPHFVVVQSEDLDAFKTFAGRHTVLHSSAEVLPGDVEGKRQNARYWQARLGRDLTRLAGSLVRYVGRPDWVRYTGWHTQQITKLAFAACSSVDTVVVLDSDVIVTQHAQLDDFVSPGHIVCYRDLKPEAELRGKVQHWLSTCTHVMGEQGRLTGQYDAYFDTPFVLHAPTVRAMCQWLEETYQQPWWQVLLHLPPRQWSEFGLYKHFLRAHHELPVDWRSSEPMAYLFDASDVEQLAEQFDAMRHQRKAHYVTIHSQSSGRQLWTADAYAEAIRQKLAINTASV